MKFSRFLDKLKDCILVAGKPLLSVVELVQDFLAA